MHGLCWCGPDINRDVIRAYVLIIYKLFCCKFRHRLQIVVILDINLKFK